MVDIALITALIVPVGVAVVFATALLVSVVIAVSQRTSWPGKIYEFLMDSMSWF